MNERRKDRLASFLRDSLTEFLQDLPGLSSGTLVSLLYIEISKSGARANVFVSVWPDQERDKVASKLKMSENRAEHFIRTRLRTKYSPSIHFLVR